MRNFILYLAIISLILGILPFLYGLCLFFNSNNLLLSDKITHLFEASTSILTFSGLLGLIFTIYFSPAKIEGTLITFITFPMDINNIEGTVVLPYMTIMNMGNTPTSLLDYHIEVGMKGKFPFKKKWVRIKTVYGMKKFPKMEIGDFEIKNIPDKLLIKKYPFLEQGKSAKGFFASFDTNKLESSKILKYRIKLHQPNGNDFTLYWDTEDKRANTFLFKDLIEDNESDEPSTNHSSK